jgi:chromosomal replication initiation ATPase DnaA
VSRQLVLPLEMRQARGRDDFLVAPCNETAVRFIDRWPDWPAPAALYGPRGCGKSHLVAAWLAVSKGESVAAGQLTAARVPTASDVAVEDVDDPGFAPDEERDRALLALFERSEGTLLLTGMDEPAHWPAAIRDLKSRFAALVAFPMWAPDDALLSGLARKLYADRQLEVPDAVIARMLLALERTPGAVADFVAKADRKALSERRKITERLVSELLDEEGA